MTVFEILLHSEPFIQAIILISLMIMTAGWSWILYRRFKRAGSTLARISELKPFFQKSSPWQTGWLEAAYEFQAASGLYCGKSVVPLQYFFPMGTGYDAVIVHDVNLDLPVLCFADVRIVGEEHIEHELLKFISVIPVRYILRNPEKNFSLNSDFILEQKSL